MAHACPFFGSCSTEQQSTGQGGERSTYKRVFYVHLHRLTRLPIDSPQLIINNSESSFLTHSRYKNHKNNLCPRCFLPSRTLSPEITPESQPPHSAFFSTPSSRAGSCKTRKTPFAPQSSSLAKRPPQTPDHFVKVRGFHSSICATLSSSFKPRSSLTGITTSNYPI